MRVESAIFIRVISCPCVLGSIGRICYEKFDGRAWKIALEVVASKYEYTVTTHVQGIRRNLSQFSQQLLQVFFVGLTIGMQRTVVPVLAESEFGVPAGSAVLLMAFVVSFGFVKGAMNFISGRLSERAGRRPVLIVGWLVALPIPFIFL
jgi:hypothetical protein